MADRRKEDYRGGDSPETVKPAGTADYAGVPVRAGEGVYTGNYDLTKQGKIPVPQNQPVETHCTSPAIWCSTCNGWCKQPVVTEEIPIPVETPGGEFPGAAQDPLYTQGWTDAIEAVRAFLANYPHAGGDEIIMQHVERLREEAITQYLQDTGRL